MTINTAHACFTIDRQKLGEKQRPTCAELALRVATILGAAPQVVSLRVILSKVPPMKGKDEERRAFPFKEAPKLERLEILGSDSTVWIDVATDVPRSLKTLICCDYNPSNLYSFLNLENVVLRNLPAHPGLFDLGLPSTLRTLELGYPCNPPMSLESALGDLFWKFFKQLRLLVVSGPIDSLKDEMPFDDDRALEFLRPRGIAEQGCDVRICSPYLGAERRMGL